MMKKNFKFALEGLIVLEVAVIGVLFFAFVLPNTTNAGAIVGKDNVTVVTLLQVGNVYPEILNVTINNGNAYLDLVPNGTANLSVYVIARDFNGQEDIQNITMTFFDPVNSTYLAANDNNRHYTNLSCAINLDYGDIYEVAANCTLGIFYYANNATWNATAVVTDNSSKTDSGDDLITVNLLLALALPDNIDYGIVNATDVSDEIEANVSNVGNAAFNLSLYGYAVTTGDGRAMNCSLGALKNISIQHEKYNLSQSNAGPLTFGQIQGFYRNLSSSIVYRAFDLDQRQDDSANEAFNSTYWRIYVPMGVAGSCRGNIVFGAVQTDGT